jgi:hypothetical protein
MRSVTVKKENSKWVVLLDGKVTSEFRTRAEAREDANGCLALLARLDEINRTIAENLAKPLVMIKGAERKIPQTNAPKFGRRKAK